MPSKRTSRNKAGGKAAASADVTARAERRLGVPQGAVRIEAGGAADALGARGAAADDRVSLGRDADRLTLAHELVHVAQARRFGTGGGAVSSPGDPAEREATLLAPQLLSGEGPIEVNERPSARISLDGPGAGPSPPEPGTARAEAGWSFDPYAEPIVGLGNRDLALRTIAVRQWLTNHTMIELDYQAYQALLGRLDIERDFRIDLGHLWLEDVAQGTTLGLVRLMIGQNGALDVVSVTDENLINGPPQDLGGQPVMTLRQFSEYLARNGIPQITLAEYLRSVSTVQFGASEDFRPPAPGSDGAFAGSGSMLFEQATSYDDTLSPLTSGVVAANPLMSPRDTRLAGAFANQNAAGRQGALSELYFGTSRQALYGFGMIDQNAIQPNHPRTDFRSVLGERIDYSLKSRVPGTAAAASASPVEQFHNYLEGHAKLLGTQPGYAGFDQFMQVSADGRTPAQVRAQARQAVDFNDFDAYRGLIADPLSSSGGASNVPNYQRTPITRIYDGILQDRPFVIGDGGPDIRTVAELDAALQAGRIGVMQHTQMLNTVAASAAGQVVPNVDFGATQAQRFQTAFDAMSPSLRPQAPPPADPRFSASRRSGTAAAGSASRIDQFGSYLSGQADMFAQGGQVLHVDPADVTAYQALLRDGFAREPTPSGAPSRIQNYQRADVTRVYDGVLAQSPVRSEAGQEYRTVAEIDAALASGQLTAREHYQLIDRVGRIAARSVAPDVPADTAGTRQAQANYEAARARANDYIKRNASPEYLHSVGQGGGWRGDAHAAATYGGRAALIAALIGGGREAWNDRDQDFTSLDTWGNIGGAAAREGARGGVSSALETVAVSQTSRYLLREGLEISAGRALAMRLGARAVPGVVDLGVEVWDMSHEDRPHSGGEIAYRSGRALVIGGTSAVVGGAAGAWAGAAAGAAIGSVVPGVGTAIGFIVGLGVGVLTGWVMGKAIPTWGELGQESGDNHDAFHDRYGNRVMMRSEYNEWAAQGRCNTGHHTSIRIIDDPPGYNDRPSFFPVAATGGSQQGGIGHPWGAGGLSAAERLMLAQWIEAEQPGSAPTGQAVPAGIEADELKGR